MSGNAQESADHEQSGQCKVSDLGFKDLYLILSLVLLVTPFVLELVDVCLVFIAEAPPSVTKTKLLIELFYVTGFVLQLIGFVRSWTPALGEVKTETASPENADSNQDNRANQPTTTDQGSTAPNRDAATTGTDVNQQANTDQGNMTEPLLGAPPVKKSPRRCCRSAPWTAFWIFLTYLIVYALHILCTIQLQGYRPMNYFMV